MFINSLCNLQLMREICSDSRKFQQHIYSMQNVLAYIEQSQKETQTMHLYAEKLKFQLQQSDFKAQQAEQLHIQQLREVSSLYDQKQSRLNFRVRQLSEQLLSESKKRQMLELQIKQIQYEEERKQFVQTPNSLNSINQSSNQLNQFNKQNELNKIELDQQLLKQKYENEFSQLKLKNEILEKENEALKLKLVQVQTQTCNSAREDENESNFQVISKSKLIQTQRNDSRSQNESYIDKNCQTDFTQQVQPRSQVLEQFKQQYIADCELFLKNRKQLIISEFLTQRDSFQQTQSQKQQDEIKALQIQIQLLQNELLRKNQVISDMSAQSQYANDMRMAMSSSVDRSSRE